MFEKLPVISADLGATLRAKGWRIATAESCTGGWVAEALTAIAGSSDYFDRGFVTYSNEAKEQLLGVPRETLSEHGAVSEAVARDMAEGAIINSEADVSVAVTGIAGPGGGTAQKPVGLVHIAASRKGGDTIHREYRFGDIGRHEVRMATVEAALQMLSRCCPK